MSSRILESQKTNYDNHLTNTSNPHGTTAEQVGAAASSHTHNYAGSTSPGGAAISADKLSSPQSFILGTAVKTFNGTDSCQFSQAEMRNGHNHYVLRNSRYIDTYTDYQSSPVVKIVDAWEFGNNDYQNNEYGNMPWLAASEQTSLLFNSWGITGKDFDFNGDVYVGGDIYGRPSILSDKREKHDIEILDEKYETMFNSLRPVTFIYNNGTSGRKHIGFIAQEVEQNIKDANLTSEDFAGLVIVPEFGNKQITKITTDEEGNEIEKNIWIVDKENIVGNHYNLRYDEFTALNTHMIQKLNSRIAELEKTVLELQKEENN